MAKENVKKFLDEISTNKELYDKLMAAQESSKAEGKSEDEVFEKIVLPIAKEAGCEFTVSEYRGVQRDAISGNSISEEELENVSGGWSGCLGLGKTSGDNNAGCFCVGFEKNGDSPEGEIELSGGGVGVMVCVFGWGIGVGGTIG